MGKGLQVQLQVILRVAQKGGGDEGDLLEVTTPSAWQWWSRLWDVLLGQKGERKKGMETESLPGTFLKKRTQEGVLDRRLSHRTHEGKNERHPQHVAWRMMKSAPSASLYSPSPYHWLHWLWFGYQPNRETSAEESLVVNLFVRTISQNSGPVSPQITSSARREAIILTRRSVPRQRR